MMIRLAGAAFVVLFTAAAAVQLVAALRDKPLIDFARTLDGMDAPTAPAADMANRLEAEIERRQGCDQLTSRSRVSISVYLLQHSESQDNETLRRRLVNAERQARDALACNPLDGNLWFVTGWLRYHLVPNQSLLHEFLLNGIRFAPSNGAALALRWRVIAPHLKSLGFAKDPAVVADLRTLYQASSVSTVAAVHEMLRNNGSEVLAKKLLVEIEPVRNAAIERQLKLMTSKSRPREFLRFAPRPRP